MKVLISAYACDPSAGSEPGAGWAWARAAAIHNEVWVLTRANNAAAIEHSLAHDPVPRLSPVYFDLPSWAASLKRGQRGVRVYYMVWQMLVARRAAQLHRDIRFDVGHHLTFATDWLPAGIASIRDLPLVWGPVGGATGMPWNLWRWLGLRGLLQEALREVVTPLARRLLATRTARRAAILVAQNVDVAQRFQWHPRVVIEPNAVVDVDVGQDQPGTPDDELSAAFVGRLVPLKGLRIAIAVLARSEARRWHLHVYGEGSERGPAEQLARELQIRNRVHFHGTVPRSKLFGELASADALIHPSLHDSSPWAVAEARALGLPVVYLDRGGAPILVGKRGGIAVDASGDVVGGFARALAELPPREPDTRWTAARLPRLLDDWYHAARSLR